MPNWICLKCNHEFWGWGVYHTGKSGDKLKCPDCEGDLVRKNTERSEALESLSYTANPSYVWKTTGELQ